MSAWLPFARTWIPSKEAGLLNASTDVSHNSHFCLHEVRRSGGHHSSIAGKEIQAQRIKRFPGSHGRAESRTRASVIRLDQYCALFDTVLSYSTVLHCFTLFYTSPQFSTVRHCSVLVYRSPRFHTVLFHAVSSIPRAKARKLKKLYQSVFKHSPNV